MKYSDGSKYNGDYVNDSRIGKGELLFANGDRYEGDFDDNVPNGTGVYTYADGTVEKGEFSNYLFCGAITLPVESEDMKKKVGQIRSINAGTKDVLVQVYQKEGDKVLVMGQKFLWNCGRHGGHGMTFPMLTLAKMQDDRSDTGMVW
jgi:hypothetical protein